MRETLDERKAAVKDEVQRTEFGRCKRIYHSGVREVRLIKLKETQQIIPIKAEQPTNG